MRLVGLDFFLSAVLDRIARLDQGIAVGSTVILENTEETLALKQNLRILVLEFLEVTHHVATDRLSVSSPDRIVGQLYGLDSGTRTRLNLHDASYAEARNRVISQADIFQQSTRNNLETASKDVNFINFKTIFISIIIVCVMVVYYMQLLQS